jgi:hypothetical protein
VLPRAAGTGGGNRPAKFLPACGISNFVDRAPFLFQCKLWSLVLAAVEPGSSIQPGPSFRYVHQVGILPSFNKKAPASVVFGDGWHRLQLQRSADSIFDKFGKTAARVRVRTGPECREWVLPPFSSKTFQWQLPSISRAAIALREPAQCGPAL